MLFYHARIRLIRLIFLLTLIVCHAAVADVTVHDYLTPLIEAYEELDQPGEEELLNLLYHYEFVYGEEFGDLYYDRLSHERKAGLTGMFRNYARQLPNLVAAFALKRQDVLTIIGETEDRFREVFGAELDFPVYLWSALAPTDGKVTQFGGVRGFSLNFQVIHAYSREELEVLLAHEFFHLFQIQQGGPQVKAGGEDQPAQPMLGSLMAEGLATYASSLIVEGRPNWRYVSLSGRDDRQYKAFQALEGEMIRFLLVNAGSTDRAVWARLFSGNPEDAAPWPPRGGYYLGYRLAQRMSLRLGAERVALMPYDEYRSLVEAELSSMLTDAPGSPE